MTAFEPGASEVLTVGATRSPRATALRASRPAPIITVGFEVFVHDVIAAIATEPVRTVTVSSPTVISTGSVGTPIVRRGVGHDRLDRRRDVGRIGRRRERRRVRGREGLGRRLGDGVAVDRRVAHRLDRPLQPVRVVRPEVLAQRVERHAVLRPPRTGQRRHDRRQVERQQLVELGTVAGLPPQALFLGVALDQGDPLGRTAGEPQVRDRLVIDREERGRRPELGAHVADRGPVGEGQAGQPVAGELHERPDHAVAPQHLGDDEDEVGGRGALGQLAGQAHADDVGHGLVQRLAEQDRLGLDATDAVAEHAERVDHRRVRIGADERVREGHAVAVVDDRRQELQVDLVDDAGPGRDDAQVAERGLRPAQQLVALAVAVVLALHVEGERIGRPEPVDVDRVVDHEVDRDQRVDLGRVAAEIGHRVAHDREVDDGGHAGQVLHDHPRGHERDLGLGGHARPPRGQGLDVARIDDAAAGMAEQVLEQDADRDRERHAAGRPIHDRDAIQVREARSEGRPGAERVDP